MNAKNMWVDIIAVVLSAGRVLVVETPKKERRPFHLPNIFSEIARIKQTVA